MEKQIRQIKLHSKLRLIDRGWTKAESVTRQVPWLNVSGRWLQQAGFQAGNQVEIEVRHHELIIKKLPQHGTHRA